MFLFFKQKTAYEMRISDWSSDVCSSDLIAFNRPVDAATAQAVSAQFVEVLLAPEYSSEALALFAAKKNVRVLQVPKDNAHNAFDIKRVEIGRASCRASVGPYVKIPVVAVKLNKKNKNSSRIK